MSDQQPSRFAPQNKTTQQRISTQTVGLVALSDYRKRRAEVVEQQEREAREAAYTGTSTSTPDRSQTGTPDNAASDDSGIARPVKKPKKKTQKKLLSFDDDEQDDGDDGGPTLKENKVKANAAVGIVPKSMTKSSLAKEAAERDALRKEFIVLQEAVKATEIAIPFVFYDGANTPGGTVRMKKGDFVWVFLDKSRKVGAELGVGEQANATRAWARVGVDDLMLVRGTVIIPHHYDFYFFVINKSMGPGGRHLFNFNNEAPKRPESTPLSSVPPVSTLEGAGDEPTETKVVDRRWYERNKHIYPASTWQDFDAEKDYSTEVRKDTGGNTFFYSK